MTGHADTGSHTIGAPGTPRRYLHSLWLLSARDLKVRYATSWLGYLWSVLDPLVMSGIYWFVFTVVFHRDSVGEEPYIVFLISGLLAWVWFNAAVTDFTRAFNKDAKLVRSTAIPRSIWVNRIVLSKGLEFLFALPVLVLFAVFAGAEVTLTRVLNTPSAVPDGPRSTSEVTSPIAGSSKPIVGTSLSDFAISTYPKTTSSTALVAKSSSHAATASFQAVLARGIPPSRIQVSA